MPLCHKCHAVNEEGATHCHVCQAILPVKLGSKSAHRWERVRRQPDLVGAPCPSCGAPNPYTRLRCNSCGASLTRRKRASGWQRVWLLVGIGAAILVVLLLAALRSA